MVLPSIIGLCSKYSYQQSDKRTRQHKEKMIQFFFLSGVPLMECCHADDTSSENMIVGLPPGWVDTDVSRLYIGINPPQPGGTRAPSRSPPVSWWTKWRTDSLVTILPGIWTCHVDREAALSCFNNSRNWRAAGSLPDRSIGNVSGIQDPKDFSEWPCIKGIQSPSKSLCDCPRSKPHTNTERI